MIPAWLAALVVGYLPGALMYRAPVLARRWREALPAEERVFWSVIISVALSLAVVLGLALAGRYSFPRLVSIDAGLTVIVLMAWRARLRYDAAPRVSWPALVPVAIIGVGLWLYFPPSEYVLGGKDPGTYVNEGVQIAQRGSLVVRDPELAAVPSTFRDLFFPRHLEQPYYGLRFVGFFVLDPDRAEVVGQFPHLFPASIAVAYGLNGLSGARQAVGIWAIFGLVAVYFVGARLAGRTASAAAVGLLAINVAEVWFARYPNSEVVMQALLFAAILAFMHAVDGSRGFFGPLSGALLGLLLFLRYDALLASGAFALTAALLPAVRQRVGAGFGVALAITTTAGFWYLTVPMRAYSAYPLGFTRRAGGWWLFAVGLVALVVLRIIVSRERVAPMARRLLPIAYAAALMALAVYAYFFRTAGGGTAPHDAMSLRVFAWYVTPWALGIGTVALGVLSATRFWRDPAFFLTFATFSLFFFYKTRIVPEHFWTARRYLAMTLPGLLLATSALASMTVGPDGLARWLKRATPAAWITIAGSLCLVAALSPIAVTFWRATTPIRDHVEYAGLIPQLEQLAGQIGDRDLLVVESRDAGSDLHALAVPLADIYAKHVVLLSSAAPPKRQFEDFVTWARGQYSNVLFMGGGGTDLLTRQVTAEPAGDGHFQVPEYDSPLNAYPTAVRRKEFEYGLYRLVARAAPPRGPIEMTIGALDDLNVVRFHARERRPDTGLLFRWTRAQSFVLLSGMSSDARTLTIWMSSGGRPAMSPTPIVEVAIEDQVLGQATPIDDVQPYRFAIPPGVAARAASSDDPVRLRLRVPTWTPAAILGGSDTRDLGVILSRVEVR